MQLLKPLKSAGLGLVLGLTMACALPPVPAFAQTAANAPDSPTTPRLTVAQLRAKYGDKQSRYMPVKGMEIHYKDEGPRGAPVLYMVHGSLSTLRTWDVTTARLKSRYRIIRFDIPGYGLSGRISDEVAQNVAFLLSPAAAGITGAAMMLDFGLTAGY